MAKFKNQHFVPQAYLRQFACDADKKNIFVLIGNEWKEASIRGQCQKGYFFSRQHAQEIEERIAWGESLLKKVSNRVENHRYSSALIFLLFELHFKSSRYYCDSKIERVTQLNKIIENYLQETLLKQVEYTMETNESVELLYALQCSWKLKKYSFGSGALITSDSPVIPILIGGRLSMIIWPLNPSSIIIAYDLSFISNIRPAKEGQNFVDALNNLLALGCHKRIYSCHKRAYEDTKSLSKYILAGSDKKEEWLYIDSLDNALQITSSFLSMRKDNGVFEYDIIHNTEKIMPYMRAKEILKSKAVIFDDANREVQVSRDITYYELFCVSQLANLPWEKT